MILENGILRKIFGLIVDDVTGEWRDFITRRFRVCTKYYWDEQIIQQEMGGACGTYGAYRVSVGQPEGKRPFGRPRRRQGYNNNNNNMGHELD